MPTTPSRLLPSIGGVVADATTTPLPTNHHKAPPTHTSESSVAVSTNTTTARVHRNGTPAIHRNQNSSIVVPPLRSSSTTTPSSKNVDAEGGGGQPPPSKLMTSTDTTPGYKGDHHHLLPAHQLQLQKKKPTTASPISSSTLPRRQIATAGDATTTAATLLSSSSPNSSTMIKRRPRLAAIPPLSGNSPPSSPSSPPPTRQAPIMDRTAAISPSIQRKGEVISQTLDTWIRLQTPLEHEFREMYAIHNNNTRQLSSSSPASSPESRRRRDTRGGQRSPPPPYTTNVSSTTPSSPPPLTTTVMDLSVSPASDIPDGSLALLLLEHHHHQHPHTSTSHNNNNITISNTKNAAVVNCVRLPSPSFIAANWSDHRKQAVLELLANNRGFTKIEWATNPNPKPTTNQDDPDHHHQQHHDTPHHQHSWGTVENADNFAVVDDNNDGVIGMSTKLLLSSGSEVLPSASAGRAIHQHDHPIDDAEEEDDMSTNTSDSSAASSNPPPSKSSTQQQQAPAESEECTNTTSSPTTATVDPAAATVTIPTPAPLADDIDDHNDENDDFEAIIRKLISRNIRLNKKDRKRSECRVGVLTVASLTKGLQKAVADVQADSDSTRAIVIKDEVKARRSIAAQCQMNKQKQLRAVLVRELHERHAVDRHRLSEEAQLPARYEIIMDEYLRRRRHFLSHVNAMCDLIVEEEANRLADIKLMWRRGKIEMERVELHRRKQALSERRALEATEEAGRADTMTVESSSRHTIVSSFNSMRQSAKDFEKLRSAFEIQESRRIRAEVDKRDNEHRLFTEQLKLEWQRRSAEHTRERDRLLVKFNQLAYANIYSKERRELQCIIVLRDQYMKPLVQAQHAAREAERELADLCARRLKYWVALRNNAELTCFRYLMNPLGNATENKRGSGNGGFAPNTDPFTNLVADCGPLVSSPTMEVEAAVSKVRVLRSIADKVHSTLTRRLLYGVSSFEDCNGNDNHVGDNNNNNNYPASSLSTRDPSHHHGASSAATTGNRTRRGVPPSFGNSNNNTTTSSSSRAGGGGAPSSPGMVDSTTPLANLFWKSGSASSPSILSIPPPELLEYVLGLSLCGHATPELKKNNNKEQPPLTIDGINGDGMRAGDATAVTHANGAVKSPTIIIASIVNTLFPKLKSEELPIPATFVEERLRVRGIHLTIRAETANALTSTTATSVASRDDDISGLIGVRPVLGVQWPQSSTTTTTTPTTSPSSSSLVDNNLSSFTWNHETRSCTSSLSGDHGWVLNTAQTTPLHPPTTTHNVDELSMSTHCFDETCEGWVFPPPSDDDDKEETDNVDDVDCENSFVGGKGHNSLSSKSTSPPRAALPLPPSRTTATTNAVGGVREDISSLMNRGEEGIQRHMKAVSAAINSALQAIRLTPTVDLSSSPQHPKSVIGGGGLPDLEDRYYNHIHAVLRKSATTTTPSPHTTTTSTTSNNNTASLFGAFCQAAPHLVAPHVCLTVEVRLEMSELSIQPGTCGLDPPFPYGGDVVGQGSGGGGGRSSSGCKGIVLGDQHAPLEDPSPTDPHAGRRFIRDTVTNTSSNADDGPASLIGVVHGNRISGGDGGSGEMLSPPSTLTQTHSLTTKATRREVLCFKRPVIVMIRQPPILIPQASTAPTKDPNEMYFPFSTMHKQLARNYLRGVVAFRFAPPPTHSVVPASSLSSGGDADLLQLSRAISTSLYSSDSTATTTTTLSANPLTIGRTGGVTSSTRGGGGKNAATVILPTSPLDAVLLPIGALSAGSAGGLMDTASSTTTDLSTALNAETLMPWAAYADHVSRRSQHQQTGGAFIVIKSTTPSSQSQPLSAASKALHRSSSTLFPNRNHHDDVDIPSANASTNNVAIPSSSPSPLVGEDASVCCAVLYDCPKPTAMSRITSTSVDAGGVLCWPVSVAHATVDKQFVSGMNIKHPSSSPSSPPVGGSAGPLSSCAPHLVGPYDAPPHKDPITRITLTLYTSIYVDDTLLSSDVNKDGDDDVPSFYLISTLPVPHTIVNTRSTTSTTTTTVAHHPKSATTTDYDNDDDAIGDEKAHVDNRDGDGNVSNGNGVYQLHTSTLTLEASSSSNHNDDDDDSSGNSNNGIHPTVLCEILSKAVAIRRSWSAVCISSLSLSMTVASSSIPTPSPTLFSNSMTASKPPLSLDDKSDSDGNCSQHFRSYNVVGSLSMYPDDALLDTHRDALERMLTIHSPTTTQGRGGGGIEEEAILVPVTNHTCNPTRTAARQGRIGGGPVVVGREGDGTKPSSPHNRSQQPLRSPRAFSDDSHHQNSQTTIPPSVTSSRPISRMDGVGLHRPATPATPDTSVPAPSSAPSNSIFSSPSRTSAPGGFPGTSTGVGGVGGGVSGASATHGRPPRGGKGGRTNSSTIITTPPSITPPPAAAATLTAQDFRPSIGGFEHVESCSEEASDEDGGEFALGSNTPNDDIMGRVDDDDVSTISIHSQSSSTNNNIPPPPSSVYVYNTVPLWDVECHQTTLTHTLPTLSQAQYTSLVLQALGVPLLDPASLRDESKVRAESVVALQSRLSRIILQSFRIPRMSSSGAAMLAKQQHQGSVEHVSRWLTLRAPIAPFARLELRNRPTPSPSTTTITAEPTAASTLFGDAFGSVSVCDEPTLALLTTTNTATNSTTTKKKVTTTTTTSSSSTSVDIVISIPIPSSDLHEDSGGSVLRGVDTREDVHEGSSTSPPPPSWAKHLLFVDGTLAIPPCMDDCRDTLASYTHQDVLAVYAGLLNPTLHQQQQHPSQTADQANTKEGIIGGGGDTTTLPSSSSPPQRSSLVLEYTIRLRSDMPLSLCSSLLQALRYRPLPIKLPITTTTTSMLPPPSSTLVANTTDTLSIKIGALSAVEVKVRRFNNACDFFHFPQLTTTAIGGESGAGVGVSSPVTTSVELELPRHRQHHRVSATGTNTSSSSLSSAPPFALYMDASQYAKMYAPSVRPDDTRGPLFIFKYVAPCFASLRSAIPPRIHGGPPTVSSLLPVHHYSPSFPTAAATSMRGGTARVSIRHANVSEDSLGIFVPKVKDSHQDGDDGIVSGMRLSLQLADVTLAPRGDNNNTADGGAATDMHPSPTGRGGGHANHNSSKMMVMGSSAKPSGFGGCTNTALQTDMWRSLANMYITQRLSTLKDHLEDCLTEAVDAKQCEGGKPEAKPTTPPWADRFTATYLTPAALYTPLTLEAQHNAPGKKKLMSTDLENSIVGAGPSTCLIAVNSRMFPLHPQSVWNPSGSIATMAAKSQLSQQHGSSSEANVSTSINNHSSSHHHNNMSSTNQHNTMSGSSSIHHTQHHHHHGSTSSSRVEGIPGWARGFLTLSSSASSSIPVHARTPAPPNHLLFAEMFTHLSGRLGAPPGGCKGATLAIRSSSSSSSKSPMLGGKKKQQQPAASRHILMYPRVVPPPGAVLSSKAAGRVHTDMSWDLHTTFAPSVSSAAAPPSAPTSRRSSVMRVPSGLNGMGGTGGISPQQLGHSVLQLSVPNSNNNNRRRKSMVTHIMPSSSSQSAAHLSRASRPLLQRALRKMITDRIRRASCFSGSDSEEEEEDDASEGVISMNRSIFNISSSNNNNNNNINNTSTTDDIVDERLLAISRQLRRTMIQRRRTLRVGARRGHYHSQADADVDDDAITLRALFQQQVNTQQLRHRLPLAHLPEATVHYHLLAWPRRMSNSTTTSKKRNDDDDNDNASPFLSASSSSSGGGHGGGLFFKDIDEACDTQRPRRHQDDHQSPIIQPIVVGTLRRRLATIEMTILDTPEAEGVTLEEVTRLLASVGYQCSPAPRNNLSAAVDAAETLKGWLDGMRPDWSDKDTPVVPPQLVPPPEIVRRYVMDRLPKPPGAELWTSKQREKSAALQRLHTQVLDVIKTEQEHMEEWLTWLQHGRPTSRAHKIIDIVITPSDGNPLSGEVCVDVDRSREDGQITTTASSSSSTTPHSSLDALLQAITDQSSVNKGSGGGRRQSSESSSTTPPVHTSNGIDGTTTTVSVVDISQLHKMQVALAHRIVASSSPVGGGENTNASTSNAAQPMPSCTFTPDVELNNRQISNVGGGGGGGTTAPSASLTTMPTTTSKAAPRSNQQQQQPAPYLSVYRLHHHYDAGSTGVVPVNRSSCQFTAAYKYFRSLPASLPNGVEVPPPPAPRGEPVRYTLQLLTALQSLLLSSTSSLPSVVTATPLDVTTTITGSPPSSRSPASPALSSAHRNGSVTPGSIGLQLPSGTSAPTTPGDASLVTPSLSAALQHRRSHTPNNNSGHHPTTSLRAKAIAAAAASATKACYSGRDLHNLGAIPLFPYMQVTCGGDSDTRSSWVGRRVRISVESKLLSTASSSSHHHHHHHQSPSSSSYPREAYLGAVRGASTSSSSPYTPFSAVVPPSSSPLSLSLNHHHPPPSPGITATNVDDDDTESIGGEGNTIVERKVQTVRCNAIFSYSPTPSSSSLAATVASSPTDVNKSVAALSILVSGGVDVSGHGDLLTSLLRGVDVTGGVGTTANNNNNSIPPLTSDELLLVGVQQQVELKRKMDVWWQEQQLLRAAYIYQDDVQAVGAHMISRASADALERSFPHLALVDVIPPTQTAATLLAPPPQSGASSSPGGKQPPTLTLIDADVTVSPMEVVATGPTSTDRNTGTTTTSYVGEYQHKPRSTPDVIGALEVSIEATYITTTTTTNDNNIVDSVVDAPPSLSPATSSNTVVVVNERVRGLVGTHMLRVGYMTMSENDNPYNPTTTTFMYELVHGESGDIPGHRNRSKSEVQSVLQKACDRVNATVMGGGVEPSASSSSLHQKKGFSPSAGPSIQDSLEPTPPPPGNTPNDNTSSSSPSSSTVVTLGTLHTYQVRDRTFQSKGGGGGWTLLSDCVSTEMVANFTPPHHQVPSSSSPTTTKGSSQRSGGGGNNSSEGGGVVVRDEHIIAFLNAIGYSTQDFMPPGDSSQTLQPPESKRLSVAVANMPALTAGDHVKQGYQSKGWGAESAYPSVQLPPPYSRIYTSPITIAAGPTQLAIKGGLGTTVRGTVSALGEAATVFDGFVSVCITAGSPKTLMGAVRRPLSAVPAIRGSIEIRIVGVASSSGSERGGGGASNPPAATPPFSAALTGLLCGPPPDNRTCHLNVEPSRLSTPFPKRNVAPELAQMATIVLEALESRPEYHTQRDDVDNNEYVQYLRVLRAMSGTPTATITLDSLLREQLLIVGSEGESCHVTQQGPELHINNKRVGNLSAVSPSYIKMDYSWVDYAAPTGPATMASLNSRLTKLLSCIAYSLCAVSPSIHRLLYDPFTITKDIVVVPSVAGLSTFNTARQVLVIPRFARQLELILSSCEGSDPTLSAPRTSVVRAVVSAQVTLSTTTSV